MPYYRHTNANKRKLLDSSFKFYQTTSNRSHLMNKHQKKYQRLNIYPIKGSNVPNIYSISKKYQRLNIYPIKGSNLPNIYPKMPYYRHTNANKRELLDSSFKFHQTTSNRSHLMNIHQ